MDSSTALSALNGGTAGIIVFNARREDEPCEVPSLARANLSNKDLRGADLRDLNMANAVLRGADLRGADLRGTNLRGADLRGADLTGALIDEKTCLDGVNLWGARGIPERVLEAHISNLRSTVRLAPDITIDVE